MFGQKLLPRRGKDTAGSNRTWVISNLDCQCALGEPRSTICPSLMQTMLWAFRMVPGRKLWKTSAHHAVASGTKTVCDDKCRSPGHDGVQCVLPASCGIQQLLHCKNPCTMPAQPPQLLHREHSSPPVALFNLLLHSDMLQTDTGRTKSTQLRRAPESEASG